MFIFLEISLTAGAVLKIGEYPRVFPNFSWEILPRDVLGPITRERKPMDYDL